jgi:hypothetical protein
MIISIHQPNYLPYLGFFDKMKKSDILVIYDDAQFSKGDFQNRNKIRIHNGWKWLTVPVEKKHIPINEIRIKNEFATNNGLSWSDSHLKNIAEAYKRAPYYSIYEKEIIKIYKKKYDNLVDLNIALINYLKNIFEIETEVVLSSHFGFTSTSSERLLEIVEALDGDVYLSGASGANYLDISLFEKRDIKVEFQDYVHPIYKQCFKGLIPNMAVIDALFNAGKIL